MTQTPQEWYSQRTGELNRTSQTLSRKRSLYGWLRFLAVSTAFLTLWWLWPAGLFMAIGSFLLFMALFLFFVTLDLRNEEERKNNATLLQLTRQEQQCLEHAFTSLPDGQAFRSSTHDYAHDLDIFGHASLYQYCNRTQSEQGNALMASWLLAPEDANTIIERQAAARELAGLPAWRQQLQAYGIHDTVTTATEFRITTWLQKPIRFRSSAGWRVLQIILPLLGTSSVILYATGVLAATWFYLAIFVFFALAFYISRLIMPDYLQLNKIAGEIATLANSIRHIEQQDFTSAPLVTLKNNISPHHHKASGILKSLKGILDRLDYRLNPLVFIPLNTILFWDLHQAMALEKWKETNRLNLERWFSSLAQMEALASFGNLRFNHPHWVYPVLTEHEGVFSADDLGHPLIPPAKRVTSNFTTKGKGQLSLITGSNMAGKSTFLRSVGVNMVLAMAGAPVCAAKLEVWPMKVVSSMRVSDNLEESTSTFYAELKKLKYIIEAVNRKEKVLLLLDEILRGTNSADRHTGSSALVKQLVQQEAICLLATHDLELARLEDRFPGHLHNYHFDVQVDANDELYFDYKLKPGVCRSMNASLLMKKIGIKL